MAQTGRNRIPGSSYVILPKNARQYIQWRVAPVAVIGAANHDCDAIKPPLCFLINLPKKTPRRSGHAVLCGVAQAIFCIFGSLLN